MLEAQYYALNIPKVDVNNILTDVQTGNIDTAAQYPWDSKSWMQEIQQLKYIQTYTKIKIYDHIFEWQDDIERAIFVTVSLH